MFIQISVDIMSIYLDTLILQTLKMMQTQRNLKNES